VAAAPIRPKPGFFTGDDEQGHALAERIFNQVKDYCGMRGWEVDLAEDDTAGSRCRRR
jgi:hypothetical protein